MLSNSDKKDLVVYKRFNQFQTKWSIDKLLSELEKHGIDVCLRVTQTGGNEINISIKTINKGKFKNKITELLYTLYGIIE